MNTPTEVEQILSDEVHPDETDSTRLRVSGEHKYKYELEFNDYKTFDLLRNQVNRAEDEAGIDMIIDHIEPVVRQTNSSIEARLKVVVKETEDRYALENTQLKEFEEFEA